MSAAMQDFIQVGIVAMRDETGGFLPSKPLFIRAEDAGGTNEQTGHAKGEEVALIDVATVFADKFRQYINGTRAAERARKTTQNLKGALS